MYHNHFVRYVKDALHVMGHDGAEHNRHVVIRQDFVHIETVTARYPANLDKMLVYH